MPPPSTVSRKRTRSTNISESDTDHQPSTIPSNTSAPPKRQRNHNNNNTNPSSSTNYSLRNRSITSDNLPSSSTDISTNSERYNLRPRRPQLQNSNPHPIIIPRRARRQIPSITQHESPPSPVAQSRQYRLVYISDDDDQPTTNTQSSSTVYDENDEAFRSSVAPRRTARSTTGATRSRTITDPINSTSIDNPEYPNTVGGGHVRLNRAIEIVIDSIQSLEGAVNNFDQLVFGLIYGRLSTRTEFENIEGMIRLSRILNLNFPSRLTQEEIDALPKIKFLNNKSDSTSSILLVEKCPICLTEFTDQEIINKLHCTHLFHLQCISTWLSENDSCPTCRRKVNGD